MLYGRVPLKSLRSEDVSSILPTPHLLRAMIKSLLAPLLLVSVATAATAKNILLTNDDGWAVAIIRAQLDSLDAAGHSVSFQL